MVAVFFWLLHGECSRWNELMVTVQFLVTSVPELFIGNQPVKATQLCPTLWDPMNYTVRGILQARLLEWVAVPLHQGIFPTQGLNPDLPCWGRILYQLSHQGSPLRILEWVAYPFSSGSSQPRNGTGVFCTAGGFITSSATERPSSGLRQGGRNFQVPCHCVRFQVSFPLGCVFSSGYKCHSVKLELFKPFWSATRGIICFWFARLKAGEAVSGVAHLCDLLDCFESGSAMSSSGAVDFILLIFLLCCLMDDEGKKAEPIWNNICFHALSRHDGSFSRSVGWSFDGSECSLL